MIIERVGRVVRGLGGLYVTRVEVDGETERYTTRAKGVLKRDEERVQIGDEVKITLDTDIPDSAVISEILPRRSSLIRPPIANLDYLFIVIAAKRPAPVLETVDKLAAIAVHNKIKPVCVITKADLDLSRAEEISEIYTLAGIPVFITSSADGRGIDALAAYVRERVTDGASAAFAGASGVGKSTLMNSLFPSLSLATAEISQKIERGRHTTRHVELFDITEGSDTGFLADTPGFSLVDFERFDFFSLSDLPATFPELLCYSGECRYADCTHVGEGKDECAVARAASEGKISPSRLESYRSIWRVLKAKKPYEDK
ncbi:MAG: ribosome small subunit-dependent GTPase A [Clostridia bacterium]|nr:ribosome small subunit-dependent GTPase A [Clostridia bacterium]